MAVSVSTKTLNVSNAAEVVINHGSGSRSPREDAIAPVPTVNARTAITRDSRSIVAPLALRPSNIGNSFGAKEYGGAGCEARTPKL